MSSTSWQVLIMFHVLFSALQTLQFRAIARHKQARHAGLAVNAIAYSALYVSGLFMLPLLGSVRTEQFYDNWVLFLAAAFLLVFGLYLMFKALTHLESATATVLGTSSAVFTIILAGIFYGERLNLPQIIGIAIVLPCIWYVSLLAKRTKRFMDFKDHNWLHGLYFMLGSSLCLALAHVLEKEILQDVSVGTYVAYGWLLQVLVAWLFYLMAGQHAKQFFKNQNGVRSALQLGVVRGVTGLFFVLALKLSNNVSLMTIISNFRIIIVAVLAGWLLGERKFYYKKLVAAAISVVGLSIIFWN